MSVLDRATHVVSSAGGQVLRAATGIVAARPAAKPLHPRGAVVRGDLRRSGATTSARPTRSGVPWLDEPGNDEVLVRQSRSVGLPEGLPDVHGLALRFRRRAAAR